MQFQRRPLLLGSIMVLALASGARSDRNTSSRVPTQKELRRITKQTLLDWNQAVQTKNFTKLYNSSATAWKRKTTPAKIRRAFQKFMDRKINIKSIQRLDPVFKPKPFIGTVEGHKGVLQLSGYYETKPQRTEFHLMYVKEKSNWKLALIHVYVDSDVFMGVDGEME